MTKPHHFVRVEFYHFKAFEQFTLHLRNFNILVGPNNAGKSTILAAFRILAAAMRKASSRNPQVIKGPNGPTLGYSVDLKSLAVAEENIFFNYDDSQSATVTFKISNENELLLYFPEVGVCYLIPRPKQGSVANTSRFRAAYNCQIGFVPILGPVEHSEPLFGKEAARLALFNYQAARNFRNIWYHYPERFEEFRAALRQTWPGMDIEPPKVDPSHERTLLHMFCPEERIPREIFWSGFGFQVWCQMLTHLIQARDLALFLIDEPDIYLHSDLQRQLISILRNLGPDILIATHSTEIISEAEPDDIVLINKRRKAAQRIKYPSQLDAVFQVLGSNLNPLLTQLAKTRRAVFVEGKDYQMLTKFARKLGYDDVASRASFAFVTVDGFNPECAKNLKEGIELTLGVSILSAVIFDRDYRSDDECGAIVEDCANFSDLVFVHGRKEIENFLLVPAALDRAAEGRVTDHAKRANKARKYVPMAEQSLAKFALDRKTFVTSRCLSFRKRFERVRSPTLSEETVSEIVLRSIEDGWKDALSVLKMLPGKEALSALNGDLQKAYGVTITPTGIIEAMRLDEVPTDMRVLISSLSDFSKRPVKGDQR